MGKIVEKQKNVEMGFYYVVVLISRSFLRGSSIRAFLLLSCPVKPCFAPFSLHFASNSSNVSQFTKIKPDTADFIRKKTVIFVQKALAFVRTRRKSPHKEDH